MQMWFVPRVTDKTDLQLYRHFTIHVIVRSSLSKILKANLTIAQYAVTVKTLIVAFDTMFRVSSI